MKIKEITSQSRRDFVANYECEHCGHIEHGYGYDDDNFHNNVIPTMPCAKCGRISPKTYRALKSKYSREEII